MAKSPPVIQALACFQAASRASSAWARRAVKISASSSLEQALAAYRNGRRKNVVMAGMAKLLTTDEDVRIAAAYFASQASPLATATIDSK